MTQVASVPLTSFGVGSHGPFTTGLLPSTLVAYQITVTQGSGWPASGDVLTGTVEISNDSGSTWQFDSAATFGGGTYKGGHAGWGVGVPNSGSTTRKARLTFNVLQACTLSAVIDAL